MKFSPLIEFFPLYDGSGNSIFEKANQSYASLKDELWRKHGIYSFYNSEGEIIYVGKSKTNLFGRMRRSFSAEKSRYERYYVRHPRDRFALRRDGSIRKIRRAKFPLYAVATYVSAYVLPLKEVDSAEQLVIRLVPNDLINVRMEGNSLRVRNARPRRRKVES